MTADVLAKWAPLVVVLAMLVVGLELTVSDFTRQGRRWRLVLAATLLQPVLLSAVALFALTVFRPAPDLAVAMLVLAVAPGGLISNAYTYLVRGDVALSVALTALSTLLAPIVIPLVLPLVAQLAGGAVATTGWSAGALVQRLLLTILLPVAVGMIVRAYWPRRVGAWRRPLAAVTAFAIAVLLVPAVIDALQAPASHILDMARYAVGFTLAAMVAALPLAFTLTSDPKARVALSVEFAVRNIPIAVMLMTANGGSNEAVLFFAVYFVLDAPIVLLLGSSLRRWLIAREPPGTAPAGA